MRFARRGVPAALEFRTQRYAELGDGTAIYDSSNYSVTAWSSGELVFVLYIERSKVASACFSVNLTATELVKAVAQIKAAGLGRWVKPGLEVARKLLLNRKQLDPARRRAIDSLLSQ